MDQYEVFIDLLRRSLISIREEYFSTAYYNFYQFKSQLENLGYFEDQIFSRYSERGFAYELYFKLRCQIEHIKRINPDFFPEYFLQGEIKKMNVPEIVRMYGYNSLGGSYIPDILFHIPAADANAFVIEIKAQPELPIKEFKKDLKKLASFLRNFNYSKAIFISVNINDTHIANMIRAHRGWIETQFTEERLNDCSIIVKQYPGNEEPYIQTLYQILNG